VLHKDILKLLIPVELAGVFTSDLEVEGAALDAVLTRVGDLQAEIFADTSVELLATWEAFFKLNPPAGATTATRRMAVIAKIRAHGDIKKPYYVALAASMGYTIRIDDYTESMAAWHCAGDELLDEFWVYFTAGVGMAGDYLAYYDPILDWIWEVVVTAAPPVSPTPNLETMFAGLKPADMLINFTYL
jgi:uncharacterized protein YmfQ (DUF2313 family)